METNEILQMILTKLVSLEEGQKTLFAGQQCLEEGQKTLFAGQQSLEEGQDAMRKDIQTIKHDIKEIAFKVDVLYDWVDGIDLKVKSVDEYIARKAQ